MVWVRILISVGGCGSRLLMLFLVEVVWPLHSPSQQLFQASLEGGDLDTQIWGCLDLFQQRRRLTDRDMHKLAGILMDWRSTVTMTWPPSADARSSSRSAEVANTVWEAAAEEEAEAEVEEPVEGAAAEEETVQEAEAAAEEVEVIAVDEEDEEEAAVEVVADEEAAVEEVAEEKEEVAEEEAAVEEFAEEVAVEEAAVEEEEEEAAEKEEAEAAAAEASGGLGVRAFAGAYSNVPRPSRAPVMPSTSPLVVQAATEEASGSLGVRVNAFPPLPPPVPAFLPPPPAPCVVLVQCPESRRSRSRSRTRRGPFASPTEVRAGSDVWCTSCNMWRSECFRRFDWICPTCANHNYARKEAGSIV